MSSFSTNFFPTAIQDIIEDLHKDRIFPIDYLAGAILFVVSVLIGSNIRLVSSFGEILANIFVAIVGPQGSNKSAPLLWAVRFLEKIDIQALDYYERELAKYESLPEAQRDKIRRPEKPARLIVNDGTPEAIADIIAKNTLGIGHYVDELSKVFGDYGGRYKPQSDEELLPQLFSGAPFIIDRKTNPHVIRCERPFYSLIGCTQNETFTRIFSRDRMSSGMFARFIPVVHFELSPLKWPLIEDLPSDADNRMKKIIDKLLSIRSLSESEPIIYHLSADASTAIVLWQNDEEERLHSCGKDIEIAIFRKMQLYALKFSLILQVLIDVCGDQPDNDSPTREIGMRAATFATKLTDYFCDNARELASAIASPKLNEKQKMAYEELPTKFTTAQAQSVFSKHGLCRSELFRVLGSIRGVLVEQIQRGVYRKL